MNYHIWIKKANKVIQWIKLKKFKTIYKIIYINCIKFGYRIGGIAYLAKQIIKVKKKWKIQFYF